MMERPDAAADVVEDRLGVRWKGRGPVEDNIKFVGSGTPSNVASLLVDRPELLIEMGTFLTPADLHKLARTSSSLYSLLSSRLSPCTAARRCLTRPGSLLCESIRRYGVEGICTSLGLPLLPSDVEGMPKAVMVLVQQGKLPSDVFYVALVLHRDAVLQLRECQSGCTLPHLFARHGGWRQIYIFAIFGGDVDAPVRECGGQPGPIADPDHHTPSIVSVPTSLTPVPLSLLGPTPLLHSLRYLKLREAEALVEARADVTIADEEGRVPLSVAMRYSISSPRLLIGLAHPRVLLIKDRSGQSPLHLAAFYDRHQQVETLLSSPHFPAGFPLEALRCVNSEGFTPWEVARQEGHSRCADILRPPEDETKRSEASPRLRFASQMQCPC
ncbi:hypothetical protein FOZ61_005490 [Perkinsus olseni]|uniref:Uncharacterized protein n=1 Tax=Perkinsus olseni TaxID=32597 RepID=A0A7J6LH50_PEROL|nr:hypothetical protein FOZ61_005490 [Perkinsus olseni]